MSTSYNDNLRCVHCGVRDAYSGNRLEYRTINSDVPELVCNQCAEEIKVEQEKIRQHIKKEVAFESESYRKFIEKHLFKITNNELLPEEYKTEQILSLEKQLEFRKTLFYGLLGEYKAIAENVNSLHLNRIKELNVNH